MDMINDGRKDDRCSRLDKRTYRRERIKLSTELATVARVEVMAEEAALVEFTTQRPTRAALSAMKHIELIFTMDELISY